MPTSPASIAEQIAHHEEKLSLHEIDLPIASRIHHETRLAELRTVDPFAVERDEIETQLAHARGAERALLLEALDTVKRAQADHAGAQLLKPLPQPARVFWTGVHRSATVGPDVTDDDAHAFVRDFGTVGLSESEPSAEDRILAEIAGAPLPPAASDVDAEAIRAAQRRAYDLAEHERLVTLADDLPRAEAEAALAYVELEDADPSGSLRFGLTERERAAALLLREDLNARELLKTLPAEIRASRARLDEIAEKSRRVDLAESGPVFEATDVHGARLLCIDSSLFNVNHS